MKRHVIQPRRNWQKTVESQGFPYHTAGVRPDGEITSGTYWAEDAYYEFTSAQVDELDDATTELYARCLDAVEHVCTKRPELLSKLGIPEKFREYVVCSWQRRDPAIYGRFDLAYDGKSPPKLFEFNADTPTTLIESSVIQWHWAKEVFGESGWDQFNSIHEKLIEAWQGLAPAMSKGTPLYFLAVKDNLEEFATVEYLRDTTAQAGVPTEFLYLDDAGWDTENKCFVDLDNNPIDYAFKLYPWECMFKDEFGSQLLLAENDIGLIEAPWKAVLSNKGILPILWELFPDHPNLLPAYWEHHSALGDSWISKPILGREGANMLIAEGATRTETPGIYGDQPMVFQKLAPRCMSGAYHLSIGSWVVGGKPAGICVREDTSRIIVDKSRFVPHIFR